MVRLSPFPLAFGTTLIIFACGFYNRKRLLSGVEEVRQQRAAERRQQTLEFQEKFTAGIKRERERKAAQKN